MFFRSYTHSTQPTKTFQTGSEDACVVSCYEAGRDGFWRHRSLVAHGVTNHKGLLAGDGVQRVLQGDVDAQLDQVHQWDGSPLPPALLSRLTRAWQQVCLLTAPIQTLEAQRWAVLHRCEDAVVAQVCQRFTLRGIGM